MAKREKRQKPEDPSQLTPKDCVIVLFGATGDLAKRKLLPGLFHLADSGLMPKKYRIIGCAPVDSGTDETHFSSYVRDALDTFARKKITSASWTTFEENLSFVGIEGTDFTALRSAILGAEEVMSEPTRIIYLAVPPYAFEGTVELLGSHSIANPGARLVIEKPFGHNLVSARSLNRALHRVFQESQIFRIDHFLGRETVQNILAFRFANGLFEAVWNNRHIDYVQIDVPETLTIEGRAAFYEATGAFRDMVVTHLFQILGFLAMEPPERLNARELHRRKVEVYRDLETIDPEHVLYGQYNGYRKEASVAADSEVETLVALKASINNERWGGVNWYLRTGKAMAETRCTVTIGFKESPAHLFADDAELKSKIRPNVVVFELSDPGKVTIHLLVKLPGPTIDLEDASLSFQYDEATRVALELEAYERLFHDVMLNEHLLFNTADAIERLWEISEPLLASPPKPVTYSVGGWGPPGVDGIALPFTWHLPESGE